ncbi:MAG: AraC family transcriptional regulator [Spirochaetaceae bacterium]|nr:MAG: AraC family transcriptional regulator [Spirochaetaceae bacterium]
MPTSSRSYSTQGKLIYPKLKVPLISQKETSDFPLKISNRLRIILIEEGTGIIRLKSIHAGILAPMLVLVRENEHVAIENAVRLKAWSLYFHPDAINSDFTLSNIYDPEYVFSNTARQDRYILKPLLSEDPHSRIIPVDHITSKNIQRLMETISDVLFRQPDKMWPCTVRASLIQLLFLACSISENDHPQPAIMPPIPDSKENDRERTITEKVILHLYLNYPERISVEELARLYSTNRTSLAAYFKNQMNMTVLTYLTKLRMEIAASLLHNTYLGINEIMLKVGFQDPTHFGRIFKKHFDSTPVEYRKKYVKMLY